MDSQAIRDALVLLLDGSRPSPNITVRFLDGSVAEGFVIGTRADAMTLEVCKHLLVRGEASRIAVDLRQVSELVVHTTDGDCTFK